MKTIVSIFCACFLICSTMVFAQNQPDKKEILYVGTFSSRGSQGIYVLQFDRNKGSLKEIQTVTGGKSPSYMEIHPNKKFMYVIYGEGVSEEFKNGSVMAYSIDPSSGSLTRINEQSIEGRGPCHISIDPKGRFAYVSNYGSGSLSVFPLNKDGSIGKAVDVVQHEGSGANPNRQKGPHMHSIIPSKDGKFIYASDLGIDKVMIYAVDQKSGKLSPATVPYAKNTPGSGPRHFIIHPNGNFAFSAEELSSTIASFKVDKATGALTPLERVSMLPEDFKGENSAADIHFSPDGKFLYASNRGHQSLVINAVDAKTGKMTFVDHEATQGNHPRNFCMDEKGEYVFVANRDSDNVVVFKRDKTTGKIAYKGEQAKVPAAVCIKQVILN